MSKKKSGNKSIRTEKKEINKDLVITRIFNAPRDLVWKSWTEPERVMRWWGPREFTSPACTIDFRVGGRYLFCMRSPEGRDYWSTGAYREIIPGERIVYTDSFSDDKGAVVPASHYGMAGDWPLELSVTVTFEDLGGRTRLVLKQSGIPDVDVLDLTRQGWSTSFDKLVDCLSERARRVA